ncbi:MAG: zinc-binding dehydrogenase [Oscillatoriales cyanobacterium C42_A2020_001]|nr:zinc-binding dehydrogenase [Leptolyngbyaceae cyanobacterium C42_A2020_001]
MPTFYRKLVAACISDSFKSAIALQEVPLKAPNANEIVIRNCFAGINAGFDTLLCRGEVPYVTLEPPFDLGVEAVGEVVAVGDAVTEFQVGDGVGTTGRGGGYREYQILPAQAATKIREVSPEVLTLMPTGVSALVALEQAGEMTSGETVLVTAAAGGTGHIAVQLALLAGNRVIAVCGSESKANLLRSLPCTQTHPHLRIINYRHEDLDVVLRREYPSGVNLVFDCVGKHTFDTCINHLAIRGRLVVVGFISEYANQLEAVTQPRIYHKLFWKAASVRGFLMPHYAEYFAHARDRLLEWFYNGTIHVIIDPTMFHGIESIPNAVEYLLSGQSCGKVVVRF